MLVRCLFHTISTSNFIVISKKKLTTEKMLRTVREVADAENGSAFLNIEFNGSANSTEKAPLITMLVRKLTSYQNFYNGYTVFNINTIQFGLNHGRP